MHNHLYLPVLIIKIKPIKFAIVKQHCSGVLCNNTTTFASIRSLFSHSQRPLY
ncbi:hypothetical protein HanXRQr2_Chr14g0657911 [Helianthus annuus]|uniref:Uncharacterized protein n=1 Tax=Helianthus annuus TaxID=4232 RepID=A0A9K3EB83_HELAN|nr:hypothetical protein HanXRQr2_Chr14g0657911 [Helianthus annuus]